jgi:hypothetical protein
MRRRTGLPHRIVVDEAHYFLHDAGAHHLLDLDANGYTVVTFCASRLPPELLAATEVMIVTCESSPSEIEALCRCCAKCGEMDHALWAQLGHLGPGQAVALPITAEASGELRLFTIGRRLTPHVRHREKYVDVPVSENHAFRFSANGKPPRSVRTLRQFVAELEDAGSAKALDAYFRRGDFSRWIADVFGDYPLAEQLRKTEEQYRNAPATDRLSEVANAIRARYDLMDPAFTS